jgi:hypothetical protein
MFRVEAFVDDKRLAQLLHAMTGVITGAPTIQPVGNAAVSGGKVTAANSGELCDMFWAYAKKHKLTTFKVNDMRNFCKTIGMAESSRGYVLKKLFACHAVKKTGKGSAMSYTVVAK